MNTQVGLDLFARCLSVILQLDRQAAIEGYVKQISKDPEAIIGLGCQKGLEPPLGQQDDLAELFGTIVQQPLNLRVNVQDLLFSERFARIVFGDLIKGDARDIEQPCTMALSGYRRTLSC